MDHRYRNDPTKSLVGFLVGGAQYALPIGHVREIVRPLEMVCLPYAPVGVVGVADYRGEVIPIVDLRARFGQPMSPTTRKTKWIVAIVAARTVALVVDAVTEVFGGSDLRPAPSLGTGDAARAIAGITSRDGLVFVLEPSQLADLVESLGAPKAETGSFAPLLLSPEKGT